MNAPAATMIEGPLGSTFHVLRADPETVAALAALDWNRHFRRVSLDPVRGLVTVMLPSHLHEDLTGVIEHVVEAAADTVGRRWKALRSTRLRREGEPPGTGLEPDCAFYVGDRADAFRAAFAEGEAAAEAFLRHTGPDLVVETEITNADEGKTERYGQMGVRELWRLRGRRERRALEADFLALRRDGPPRLLAASQVLDGLTPADVCEAVEPVRAAGTLAERTEAVARIVRRRRRGSVRVREEAPPYSVSGHPRGGAASVSD